MRGYRLCVSRLVRPSTAAPGNGQSRRHFLRLALLGPAAAAWPGVSLAATERFDSEVALFAAGRPVRADGLNLEAPPVAESGYSVPVTVTSAGTGPDRVVRVRLLAPDNPLVRLATVTVGDTGVPLRLSTRIRLARSQTVVALAETAGGQVLRAEAAIAVVVGGCGFDLPLEPG